MGRAPAGAQGMNLRNEADFRAWLTSADEVAAAHLSGIGLSDAEIQGIRDGKNLMVTALRALARRKRAFDFDSPRSRAAANILRDVQRIRTADKWQLVPLGYTLHRWAVAFNEAEFEDIFTRKRQKRASAQQAGRDKSPVTRALREMLAADNDDLTAQEVHALARVRIERAGVRILAVNSGTVRFLDLGTDKYRDVKLPSITRALSRLKGLSRA